MTRHPGALALVLAALALAGCGITPANPFTEFAPLTTKIAAFTAADVQTALDDANKNDDVVGALCWGTVQKALPALQPPKAAGGATAIQLGRDVQRKLPDIADACANILPTGLVSLAGLVGG